jgi:hypothetical protein
VWVKSVAIVAAGMPLKIRGLNITGLQASG